MRLLRPIVLFVFLCGLTASTQSQVVEPISGTGTGYNIFLWAAGSPVGTIGGVDASVTITPTTGWVCTSVTLRVIDDTTNKTLGEYTVENPGMTVSKSFTGFDSNLAVRVTGNVTFQNGAMFDFKDLEAYVTTK